MVKNSILNKDSRYVQGGRTTVTTNRIDWWERYKIASSTDDIKVTIMAEYDRRPDRLAKDLYGRSTLMWVILQYNNIVDVNEEFIGGAEILCPTPARLMLNILNKTKDISEFK